MRVKKSITVEEFRVYAKGLKDFDHPLVNLTDEVLDSVVQVIECFIEEKETVEDTSSYVLVKLRGGGYGVFQESSDSSGHG